MKDKIYRVISSAVVTLPLFFNLYFFQISSAIGTRKISAVIFSVFVTFLMFMTLYKRDIYKYRRVFFIAAALLFFPSFMSNLISNRGSVTLEDINMIKNEVPFCHMVTPSAIIPYAFTKTLIFPSKLFNSYTSVYSMLMIWLLATLTMGRGWCSWVCFYGGWDELSSSIGKKKRLKLSPNSSYVRYFKFTMLIFLALASLKTLSVVYCEWFCPLKLITEHGDTNSIKGYLQFIFMVVLFIGLLIVLPFLTKKRFQCGTYCPFGAFQSLVGKVSPFRVIIDAKKCTECSICLEKCPTLSITSESLKKGKTDKTCTLCGKCLEVCPKKAISLRFSWLKRVNSLNIHPILNNILSPISFLSFVGLLIGSIVCGGFMVDTINKTINLFGALL